MRIAHASKVGLKVLSSSKIEVTGVLDGGWYGDIEIKGKSVFDVLVEGLQMHDLQHPEHKESYVKFVWGRALAPRVCSLCGSEGRGEARFKTYSEGEGYREA